MITQRILRATLVGISLASLSGCSTIKSWFPDKERDYQFTTEIPELVVPEDLKNKGLALQSVPNPAPVDDGNAVSAAVPDAVSAKSADGEAPDDAAENKAAPAENAQAVAPVNGDISSLQIDQAKTPATRMVGRALTRQEIEIVERNIEKGFFYVKYDPNAVEAKDDSIWDEINFMFGDDPSQEREYRIRVRGINSQLSEVTVQDESGKPLSDNAANALLKLITEGINKVLSQPESADSEGAEAESSSKSNPEPNSPNVDRTEPVIQE